METPGNPSTVEELKKTEIEKVLNIKTTLERKKEELNNVRDELDLKLAELDKLLSELDKRLIELRSL